MKKNSIKIKYGIGFVPFMMLLGMFFSQPLSGESMNEMVMQFEKEYEAAKPAPNSSVNADYKLEQTALGTFYTTKAINKLFDQNKEMLEKYNEIVSQNKEIIRLLSIIAKKEVPFEDIPEKGVPAPIE